jgi:hypothetical protein
LSSILVVTFCRLLVVRFGFLPIVVGRSLPVVCSHAIFSSHQRFSV